MGDLGASLIRPEPGASLPAFARLAPPPPRNVVAAELEGRTSPGDVVIDLHARGGWIARAAIAALRRGYTFEQAPLTRLLAEVVLRPPDLRHLDAAIRALSGQPRGDATLRDALVDLFASRCVTCKRTVRVEAFLWEAQAEAPSRKVYRCTFCRDQAGAPEIRTELTDADDRARATGVQASRERELLRERFPADPTGDALAPVLLDLYPPRALIALHALIERIEGDLRAAPIQGALRLALFHVVLPATRLGRPGGRHAPLRVAYGRVRLPRATTWREHDPWALFEDGCRLVSGFVQALESATDSAVQARVGSDLGSLLDGAANVVMRGGSAGDPGNEPRHGELDAAIGTPRGRVRLVLTQPPLKWPADALAHAFLGTALTLGREAAESVPAASLLGPARRVSWGRESSTFRRALEAVRPVLAADARVIVLLDEAGPDPLVASVLGGVGAGFGLDDVVLTEGTEGFAGTLEFLMPGERAADVGIPRTRANVPLPPLVEDPAPFRLSDVERAVDEVAVEVLQARGEPARFERIVGEVLVGLDRRGLLRRLVGTQTFAESEAETDRRSSGPQLLGVVSDVPLEPSAAVTAPPGEPALTREPTQAEAASVAPAAASELVPEALFTPDDLGEDDPAEDHADEDPGQEGTEGATPGTTARAAAARGRVDHVGLVLELVFGELRRPDHRRLVEIEPGRWWLRDPRDVREARPPLADRLEWAVFSLLSTSGGMTEAAFLHRMASMFRGHDSPEDALVAASLASYRDPGGPVALRPEDALQRRAGEHARLLATLVELGHRLGLRVAIGEAERRRVVDGVALESMLSEQERHVHLPLVVRGPEEALNAVDCLWYVRNRAAFLWEVEWTAMLGDVLLKRGAAVPTDASVVRFLVVVPERVDLVRFKLDRSAVLREAWEAGNWHLLRADQLQAFAAREEVSLDALEPYLGFAPAAEIAGEQLPLFG